MAEQQNFANHARFVPGYHRFTLLLILVVLVWSIKQVATGFSVASVMQLITIVALLFATFYARAFAAKGQDRIIRVEERERMGRLLPDDLKARIGELRLPQFVALRFASDGELADLVRRTLGGEFAKPRDIKVAVKSWRGDYERV